MTARAALLQALIAGPGYGLDLIERVKRQTNGAIVLGQGSIYPALRAMEDEGLLESYESEPVPERGGRPRVFYRVTAEGHRAAQGDRSAMMGLLGLTPGAA